MSAGADAADRQEPRHAEPVSRAESIISRESARLGAVMLLDRINAQCADELGCSGNPADGCTNPGGCDLVKDIVKYLLALARPQ